MNKQNKPAISIRSYELGDENTIVDLLNLSYPLGWGNMKQWEYYYSRNPFFDANNVFIIESNDQIIGHRSFELLDLVIRGKKITMCLFHDTATHPDYRGFGLYSRLHEATLKAAKLKGACLVDAANSRGSITYNHNKKTGFIEIKRSYSYVKIINYEKYFREGVLSFINRSEKLKSLLNNLTTNLYIQFGKSEFSLNELLNEGNPTLAISNKNGTVVLVLVETSLSLIIRLMSGTKLQKVRALLDLFFSRKIRIKFSSPLALMKVALVGIRVVRYG